MSVRYPKPSVLSKIPSDRHAVVEASAGTGKTYTLEHLVLDVLLETDHRIEQILVVTFTDKAACELRHRLRRKITEILQGKAPELTGAEAYWTIDDEAKRKLNTALMSFDSASISTIHAFCQRMLVDHAFLNQRLFEQELIDGRASFSRAFLEETRHTFAHKEPYRPYLDAWLEDREIEDLEALLYDCLQRRGRIMPHFAPDKLSAIVQDLMKLDLRPHALRPALTRCKLHEKTQSAVLTRVTLLRRMLSTFQQKKDLVKLLAALSREEQRMSGGFLRFIVDRLSGQIAHVGIVSHLFDAVRLLDESTVPLASAVAQMFLPVVSERLQHEKARFGHFDFTDMLALLRENLFSREGASLRETVRRRFRYALIDEFQDTDEIQWDIFRRLFLTQERSLSGRSHNILYVIGDPKQAIYGFRGADVHTYLAAKKQILARLGSVVPLVENHRSSAPLIDAINELLDQKRPEPFFTGDIKYDHPSVFGAAQLSALEENGRPLSPVKLFQISSKQQKLTPKPLKTALGKRIAMEIRRLLGPANHDGTDAIRLRTGDKTRPLKANDIFILTRSGREGLEVAEHLRRANVPHAFYKQDGLFQTQEAADIRALLAAVASPYRRSLRIRSWQGPFFAVPLSGLTDCEDLPGTHPLMARVLDWKALADSKDYERLFTSIIEESGIITRELFLRNSERELTNYLHIFEILQEEASRTRATLPEIIYTLSAFIEGRRLPEGEDGNVQRLESEREAVQIMTMHKSKGLEAPIVFLFGGFEAVGGIAHIYHEQDERRLYVGHTPPPPAEREKHEEDQRLLYVSITRARVRLYLPYIGWASSAFEPVRELRTLDGAYAELNSVLDPLFEGEHPLFAREVVWVEEHKEKKEKAEAGKPLSRWCPDPDLLQQPSAPAPHAIARHGHVITSYSRIKASRGGYHPPEPMRDAEEADVLRGDVDTAGEEEGLPAGSVAGRFLHEVLEKIPLEQLLLSPEAWRADPETLEVFHSALKRYNFPTRYLEQCQELVYRAMTSEIRFADTTIEGIGRDTNRIVREMEFLYPIPEKSHPPLGMLEGELRITKGFIKGFIDLVCERDGRTYIVDWKSDLLPTYSAELLALHVEQNYSLQAELYTLALVKLLRLSSEEAFERSFGGTAYLFIRGLNATDPSTGVYFARPTWAEVQRSIEHLLDLDETGGLA